MAMNGAKATDWSEGGGESRVWGQRAWYLGASIPNSCRLKRSRTALNASLRSNPSSSSLEMRNGDVVHIVDVGSNDRCEYCKV